MTAADTSCTGTGHQTPLELARMFGEFSSDAVIAVDDGWRIVFLSKAAERLYGIDADAVVGRPLTIFIAPEYRETYVRHAVGYQTGEIRSRSAIAGGVPGLKANGDRFHAEVSIARISDGRSGLMLINVRDVTDRVNNERRLRGIFEATPIALLDQDYTEVGVWLASLRKQGVVDLRSHLEAHPDVFDEGIGRVRIVDVNDAAVAISGSTTADEVRGHLEPADIVGGNRDSLLRQFEAVWEDRDSLIHRYSPPAAGDREMILHWKAQRIDGELNLDHVVVAIVDVTELHEAQRHLAAAQEDLERVRKLEAIGQLAAGVAHEINTPLQYVSDNVGFLNEVFAEGIQIWELSNRAIEARHSADDVAAVLTELEAAAAAADIEFILEEIPRAFADLHDGVARVTKIVQALKEFAHPGSGGMAPEDVNAIIETSVAVSRNEWKYSASIELDLDGELPPVPCLRSELSQVMVNLLVNAGHAIEGAGRGEKGLISVATACSGTDAVITVADNGTGMPDDVRRRVFEPFFTTKPVGKGTGQGLAMAHKVIVDQHSGGISVDSAPGVGTTFTIRLPIAHVPAGRGDA